MNDVMHRYLRKMGNSFMASLEIGLMVMRLTCLLNFFQSGIRKI